MRDARGRFISGGGAGVKITRDTISPGLAKMAAGVRDRKPILEAMGTALAALARRAWRDEALRPLPWPPTKTGRPPLYRTGDLVQSIRVAAVTNDTVTVATNKPYAIFHQFGTKRGLPPRPFFPFDASGKMTGEARRRVEAAARAAMAARLAP